MNELNLKYNNSNSGYIKKYKILENKYDKNSSNKDKCRLWNLIGELKICDICGKKYSIFFKHLDPNRLVEKYQTTICPNKKCKKLGYYRKVVRNISKLERCSCVI